MWVRSPFFELDDPLEAEWLETTGFSGTLSTYDQSLQALPRGFVSRRLAGYPVRPHAYVINPAHEYEGRSLEFFRSHFWVPIEGAHNALFLWADTRSEGAPADALTGVLECFSLSEHEARSREYAQFGFVLGEELPRQIGVIELRSAEDYNREHSGAASAFVIFGIMWLGSGLVGIALFAMTPRGSSSRRGSARSRLCQWSTSTRDRPRALSGKRVGPGTPRLRQEGVGDWSTLEPATRPTCH